MGSITILHGPDFDNKLEKLQDFNVNTCLIIKSSRDVRGDIAGIHILSVENLEDVTDMEVNGCSVIGILEGQFFENNISRFCTRMKDMGKKVIVTTTDSGISEQPLLQLVPLAEVIERID